MTRGASLAITHAHILTMDPARPVARAIVIHDGIITYVGSDEGAKTEDRGVDEHIDAGGRTLIPGFNDAHGHFIHDGIMAIRADLTACHDVAEAYARIRAHMEARPDDPVVIAEKWDESDWDPPRFPTRDGLDAISTERPILARRIDGHVAVANTALLDLYDERWDGPTDGIYRDTGILLEEPSLNFNLVCPPSAEDLDTGLAAFLAKAARLGVTSAQDFANPDYWKAWQRRAHQADRDGYEMGVRADISTYTEHLDAYLEAGLMTGTGDDRLRVGGLKIFADGSMGGHSAYLREPYADRTDTRGLRLFEDDALVRLVERAQQGAIQVRMHVIGDGAVAQGTAAFEHVAESVGLDAFRAMRHRFEHYEMSDRPLRDRAKTLGIVLSMQPNFVGAWSRKEGLYGQRLGDRHDLMNPMRAIWDEGLQIAFGSDCMPFGPIHGIAGVVTAPYAHMRLTLHEAISAYTLGAAYGQHREHVKGQLVPGRLGDLALLNKDLGTGGTDREHLDGLAVHRTILGGRTTFQATT